jgi:hypothetical protein
MLQTLTITFVFFHSEEDARWLFAAPDRPGPAPLAPAPSPGPHADVVDAAKAAGATRFVELIKAAGAADVYSKNSPAMGMAIVLLAPTNTVSALWARRVPRRAAAATGGCLGRVPRFEHARINIYP